MRSPALPSAAVMAPQASAAPSPPGTASPSLPACGGSPPVPSPRTVATTPAPAMPGAAAAAPFVPETAGPAAMGRVGSPATWSRQEMTSPSEIPVADPAHAPPLEDSNSIVTWEDQNSMVSPPGIPLPVRGIVSMETAAATVKKSSLSLPDAPYKNTRNAVRKQLSPDYYSPHENKTKEKEWEKEIGLFPLREVLLTTEAAVRTRERGWIHASRIKGPVEKPKEWTISSEPGETKLTLKRK
ncbi:transcription initiation factor TFIID subunit 4-like [Prinia subflava]